jgi:chemotaxis protein MotB
MADDQRPIIIIKRIKKGGHGHHGGAWKVAYADFVTAMMAFFLLLWLLNSVTVEQKEGIANYFAPTSVSSSTSGAGGILGGQSMSEIQAMKSDSQPIIMPTDTIEGIDSDEALEEENTRGSNAEGAGIADKKLQELQQELRAKETKDFENVQKEIKKAMESDPALAMLSQNLIMEITKEGLRIQLIDQDKRPMFETGGITPLPHTKAILQKVSEIISKLPNEIAVAGHTDSTPFAGQGYTNWELSADRANAVRKEIEENGVSAKRIASVSGKADREPLLKDAPDSALNRRVSVTLLYTDLMKKRLQREAPAAPIKDGVFRQ